MKKIILMSVLSLFMLTGCSWFDKGIISDNSPEIINVNGTSITQNMYDEQYEDVVKNSPLANRTIDMTKPRNKFQHLVYKLRIVNTLIVQELLEQEIQKFNIKVTDDEINSELNKAYERVGGEENFNQVLKENKIKKAEFVKMLKEELRISKLIDKVVVTKVSKSDAKKYYEENKSSKFTTPDLVRASHILISVSEDEIKNIAKSQNPKISNEELTKKVQFEMAEKKKRAQMVLGKAKASPENFAALAKKYSDDYTSATNGGDLGFFSKEEMVKEFSKAAFSLKPGSVSELVKTEFGYHIILVQDRKKAGVTTFDEVEDEIMIYLTNQNKLEGLNNFIESIKTKADIKFTKPEYNPNNIQKEIEELSQSLMQVVPNKEVPAK